MVGIELVGSLYVVLRGQQEAARAATRVTDGLLWLGLNALYDGVDERSRREVLTGTRFGVLRYSLKQPLVDVAFDVLRHSRPRFCANHLNNSRQDRRRAHLVLGPGKNLLKHAALGT